MVPAPHHRGLHLFKRRVAAAVTAVALAGTLAGCGDDEPESQPPLTGQPGGSSTGSTPSDTPTPGTSDGADQGALVGPAAELGDVIDAALAAAPGGTVVGVDWEDGRDAAWEVDLLLDGGGVELRLDGQDLRELGRRDQRLGDEGAPKIDARRAAELAVAEEPGMAQAIDLGDDGGRVVWEVEVRGADDGITEVTLDAGDGTVVSSEHDE